MARPPLGICRIESLVLKYHGKIWYNFVEPNFAIPSFVFSKSPFTQATVLFRARGLCGRFSGHDCAMQSTTHVPEHKPFAGSW